MLASMTAQDLARRVRVARGEAAGDLLLAGGSIVNVFTGAVERGDVVVVDGVIAGAGPYEWTARETIDVRGGFVAPGLIDAHIHIESTLLVPAELARVVVPRGTSAVVADPHEIGNVLGPRGVEIMLAASEGLALDCFFMAPSCVPASPFESAGATIDAVAVGRLLAHPRVLGLAEMMNFPGVLGADAEVMAKIAATHAGGGVVDGHAPGLGGRDLHAYASAGIRSDHECTTAHEALERAALGMLVQVREGSMARNLDEMIPIIRAGRLGEWCLCTDDVLPGDLIAHGHLDALLARLVAGGVPAPVAIRHAALVPARHYGLGLRGAVAPGYRADLVVFADLTRFGARLVLKDGRVVACDGACAGGGAGPPVPVENTVHLGRLDESSFSVAAGTDPVPVIEVIPDQIVTRAATRRVPSRGGRFAFDAATDVALIACVERHRPSGRVGAGLVAGFTLRRPGALGSSVGHDAHNLVIAGTSEREMLAAARGLAEIGGGFVAVENGAVTATLPLPVAGLMTTENARDVCARQREIDAAAARLGCALHSPFGTLSFLALTVIPSLRITDRGLFDVERFALVESPAKG
jgi:adenine deaminase